jgi:FlaA1/EpsC-like NDP-sugar epimerase
VISDTLLVVLCFYAAYLLRFEGAPSSITLEAVLGSLPIVLVACLSVFFLTGIYRGQWRLISVGDLPRYGVAIFGGAAVAFVMVRWAGLVNLKTGAGHSTAAFLIFATLLLLAVVSSRLSFRLLDTLIGPTDGRRAGGQLKLVLVYGAGRAGKLLYEEVLFNPDLRDFAVVGFVDDDFRIVGRELCGVPIKTPAEWSRRSWRVPPDVWVSSRLVPDDRAQEFAARCGSGAAVRRLAITLNAVTTTTTHGSVLSTPD